MIIDLLDKTSIKAATTLIKSTDSIIGLTSGCFDMIHYYHLNYLEQCKLQCDYLIVGVDSDHMVRGYKGKNRPIFNHGHRMKMINSLKCVDYVFLLDRLNTFDLILNKFMKKGIIFRNQDFLGKEDMVIGSYKYPVIIIPDTEELMSTSQAVMKIQSLMD